MSEQAYPFPVSELLTLGDRSDPHTWQDYQPLGLGPEHIPDLIRMATDETLNEADSESPEVWAPLHAWRALGQLRAEAAIEPLLGLLRLVDAEDGDDWILGDFPKVCGLIGPAAIPTLSAYLADSSHGLYARVATSESLSQIGQMHPGARNDCVAVLTRQLEKAADNNATLNAFVISALADLEAVESAPTIERAFAEDCVDWTIMGDWEDVQIELGLKEHRETPRPRCVVWDSAPGGFPRDDEEEASRLRAIEKRRARKKRRRQQKKLLRKRRRRR